MIPSLLHRLYQRGARFRIEADKVKWFGPTGVVGPEDLASLKASRDEVFDLVDAVTERAAIREFDGEQCRNTAPSGCNDRCLHPHNHMTRLDYLEHAGFRHASRLADLVAGFAAGKGESGLVGN